MHRDIRASRHVANVLRQLFLAAVWTGKACFDDYARHPYNKCSVARTLVQRILRRLKRFNCRQWAESLRPASSPNRENGRAAECWAAPIAHCLLSRHCNAHALFRRDEVIEIHRIFADVDLDPLHFAAELRLRILGRDR